MFFNYKWGRDQSDFGLLDFQLCAGGAPSVDISVFFWLTVSDRISSDQERECLQAYYDQLIERTDAAKYEYWATFEAFYDIYRVLLSLSLAACAIHTTIDPQDDIAAKKMVKVTRAIIAHCARNNTLEACTTFLGKLQSGEPLTINVEAFEEKRDVFEEKTDDIKYDDGFGEAGALPSQWADPSPHTPDASIEPVRKFSENVLVNDTRGTSELELVAGLTVGIP